jgi:hypothetical protein
VNNLAAWLNWRDAFIAMLDPALYTAEWLDRQVTSGEFLLFHAADAAILASLRHYPTGATELEGQAAAGNLATIVGDLIPTAEQYARRIGCSHTSISSRPGWERVMKPHGYHVHQVTIRKAL